MKCINSWLVSRRAFCLYNLETVVNWSMKQKDKLEWRTYTYNKCLWRMYCNTCNRTGLQQYSNGDTFGLAKRFRADLLPPLVTCNTNLAIYSYRGLSFQSIRLFFISSAQAASLMLNHLNAWEQKLCTTLMVLWRNNSRDRADPMWCCIVDLERILIF